MKKNKIICFLTIIACMLGTLTVTSTVEAKGYGKVIGKFVFKGDIPKTKVLVKKGNAAAKDAKVCAVKGVESQALVIDQDSKGIKNIVIYIKKMKSKYIHPDLKKSKTPLVDYDQVGCKFVPHILFVRTDQQVRVLSNDPINHNFHSIPIKGKGQNFLVGPTDRVGTKVKTEIAESLPIPVQCDIHPWMKGHWMILDHPYCAITKADGSFEIDLVPEGKQDFRVWQESKGYINAGYRTGFKAKIKDGKTFDLGTIELTADDLK